MTVAVYAGSFDPITTGHRSIFMQGLRMFSHVRLLIANNPNKKYFFNFVKRLHLVQGDIEGIPNLSVSITDGLVIEHARSIGAGYLLRGIRNESDVLYELKLAEENKKLAPEIQTVFLPADPEIAEVSSSKLKELVQAGADVSKYCSSLVKFEIQDTLRNLEKMRKLGLIE